MFDIALTPETRMVANARTAVALEAERIFGKERRKEE